MPAQLSHEEIERMRQIVQQHDAERKPMQVFDLNNPPKEPYRFQKFPMMVYDLTHSEPGHVVSQIVRSEEELESALARGWVETAPAYPDQYAESLSVKYEAEADRIDSQIQEARRRKKAEVA